MPISPVADTRENLSLDHGHGVPASERVKPIDPQKESVRVCPACEGTNLVQESVANSIWSCVDCRLFFTNPRPTEKFISENYCEGGYYARFKPDAKWYGMWNRRIARVTRRLKSGRILDVSAGVGTAVHLLNRAGFQASGTEISSEAIAKAMELYGISLQYSYPEDITVADESLDGLMMWHVFEHLPFPGSSLKFLSGKIKRNGFLFIAVPNNSFHRLLTKPKCWIASRAKRLEALIPDVPYHQTFSEIHLIHFTPRSLRNVVESAGFRVLELGLDNISLNPGKLKDLKHFVRNSIAKHAHLYAHKALFVCAQKL